MTFIDLPRNNNSSIMKVNKTDLERKELMEKLEMEEDLLHHVPPPSSSNWNKIVHTIADFGIHVKVSYP